MATATAKEFGLAIPDDFSLRDMVSVDLAQFMLYLSASDGPICQQQLYEISSFLDYRFTVETANMLIKKCNIRSRSFETTPPVSYELICAFSKVFNGDLSSDLIDLYLKLGTWVFSSGGSFTAKVKRDLTNYINMLRSCADA